jgi:hypothetical protein
MERAFDLTREEHVHAVYAERHQGYVCPYCCGRVHLRRGDSRIDYFAHNPGEGTPLCEQYHPGEGQGTHRHHALDYRSSLLLSLRADNRNWSLFVELEPLAISEVGELDRLKLTFDGLLVQHPGAPPCRIRADSLWPGSGRSVIELSPSRSDTNVRTIGPWPKQIRPERWRYQVPGLPSGGVLFLPYRPGVFRRQDGTTRAHWGETVVLIGMEQAAPPSSLSSIALADISTRDGTWHAWSVRLPRSTNEVARQWLSKFGAEPRERVVRTRLLSPPVEYGAHGRPGFYLGERFFVDPSPQANVVAAESHATFNAKAVGSAHRAGTICAITPAESGLLQLRTDASRDVLQVDVITDSRTTGPLLPPWHLRVDGQDLPPYTSHHFHDSATPDITVESPNPLLTFSAIAVDHTGQHETILESDSSTLAEWIRQRSPVLRELEVTVSNLGFVRLQIPRATRSEPTEPPAKKRRTWFDAYEHTLADTAVPQLPHWRLTQRHRPN